MILLISFSTDLIVNQTPRKPKFWQVKKLMITKVNKNKFVFFLMKRVFVWGVGFMCGWNNGQKMVGFVIKYGNGEKEKRGKQKTLKPGKD